MSSFYQYRFDFTQVQPFEVQSSALPEITKMKFLIVLIVVSCAVGYSEVGNLTSNYLQTIFSI